MVADLDPNSYLCYRTSEGQMGWMVINWQSNDNILTLEYQTWAEP